MISFDLRCTNEHVFEAWFKDSQAWEDQAKAGEVACPVCGDVRVAKALMAPNIGARSNRAARRAPEAAEPSVTPPAGPSPSATPSATPGPQARAGMFLHAMREMRRRVEQNCEYVGEKFSEEVRKIHYGEAEHRNLYGEASEEEARMLDEEGIEVSRIPWVPRDDA